MDLRLYGEIAGVYDSNITPAAKPGDSTADSGVESGAGLSLSRNWKRASLNVEYRGRFNHYARERVFNGTDQFLNLGYSRFLSPNLTLDLKETAGTTTLANGSFTYLPLTDPGLYALPTAELLDGRTSYAISRGELGWQRSTRTSFDLGGEGFLVRRSSAALADLDGFGARAGIAYRLTRRQTVSATYQHTYFNYRRAFADASLDTAVMAYSVALTRHLDLGLQLGGSRVDTQNVTAHVLYMPLAEARLTRTFQRSSLVFDVATGISPGNGLYLTSREKSASVLFTYAGTRRLTVLFNAGYSQLTSLDQSLTRLSDFQGGGGFLYRLFASTHLDLRYDYRHYGNQAALLKKNSNRISLGLAFAPGDAPLAIW
jgi:hypothetical protein